LRDVTRPYDTIHRAAAQFAASNVRDGVIPDPGHWIMEENPRATITMVRAFLEA
jgi:pimeloyl-ACP methyl ester carboxylesterase